eukprot:6211309-Pleurochrysis_carterae.AAC.1
MVSGGTFAPSSASEVNQSTAQKASSRSRLSLTRRSSRHVLNLIFGGVAEAEWKPRCSALALITVKAHSLSLGVRERRTTKSSGEPATATGMRSVPPGSSASRDLNTLLRNMRCWPFKRKAHHARRHTHKHMRTCTGTLARMLAHAHARMHALAHTHTHARARRHAHTRRHARAQAARSEGRASLPGAPLRARADGPASWRRRAAPRPCSAPRAARAAARRRCRPPSACPAASTRTPRATRAAFLPRALFPPKRGRQIRRQTRGAARWASAWRRAAAERAAAPSHARPREPALPPRPCHGLYGARRGSVSARAHDWEPNSAHKKGHACNAKQTPS